jgi:hypothetical protein
LKFGDQCCAQGRDTRTHLPAPLESHQTTTQNERSFIQEDTT